MSDHLHTIEITYKDHDGLRTSSRIYRFTEQEHGFSPQIAALVAFNYLQQCADQHEVAHKEYQPGLEYRP